MLLETIKYRSIVLSQCSCATQVVYFDFKLDVVYVLVVDGPQAVPGTFNGFKVSLQQVAEVSVVVAHFGTSDHLDANLVKLAQSAGLWSLMAEHGAPVPRLDRLLAQFLGQSLVL